MRINTNIASLQAASALAKTTKALGRALERLTTGQRVNSARDDATGFALSIGLEAQRRGLNQIARNVNQAFGYLETADGALSSQMEIVQRMREIAVQASNGVLGSNERANLNEELQTLMAEFERISSSTNFNGNSLLDGSLGSIDLQVGLNNHQTVSLNLESSRSNDVFTKQSPTGEFSLQTSSIGATGPSGPALADLNGDGNLDAVTQVDGSNNIVISLGDGHGAFTITKTIYTPLTGLGRVTLGDWDGDGDLDIVANRFNGLVYTYRNDGDLDFSLANTFSIGTVYDPIVNHLKDLNNDGNLDIVAVSYTTGQAFMYLGDGAGAFTHYQTIQGLGASQRADVKDFDGDGILDLLVDTQNSDIRYFRGQGDGSFTFAQAISPAGSNDYKTGDVDGDGDSDIVVLASGIGRIYSNDGHGHFTLSSSFSSYISATYQMDLGDITGDGSLDIVATDRVADRVLIFHNSGSGTFSLATSMDRTPALYHGATNIVDLNNDGFNDILLTTDSSALWTSYLTKTESVSAAGSIDVSTQENAQNSLEIIDTAIQNISGLKARIGATQNRLSSVVSVSEITEENIAQSLSQVRDADIAQEMAELTRLQILQQAGVSVLAQANTSLQIVLSLLR